MKRSLLGALCALVFLGLTGCAPVSADTADAQVEVSIAEQKEIGSTGADLKDAAGRLPDQSEETGKPQDQTEGAGRLPDESEPELPDFSPTMRYNDTLIYREPEPGKVCIRVDPPVVRDCLSYYYIPTGEQQETLAKMIGELEVTWEKHEQRWEGMKELGWTIAYEDMEYDVFEGGYLYARGRDENDRSVEYLEQKEELCSMIQKMLEQELDYAPVDPSKIQEVVAATLEKKSMADGFKLHRQTITDEDTLALIEQWISGATYLYGGADCGNRLASLELTLADGDSVKMSLATDACPNYGLNGVYYNYTPKEYRSGGWHNNKLYQYFDEIPLLEIYPKE